ncbi:6-phospho-beta-glucosidase [Photobacterium jeanii]|uniref:6-phospho-beta-glucosidase n=1 Tax=Photobacterium jeanii TaxID=858640 RepID=A0A178K8N5_9GAMM|nr:6-phospho-beta-glucosidase [Photobacterium jeanii]OAN13710.1 6-phospho-beta-glucosidase [Photobacterium jeanii]PST88831.1 6-phospho-beta-glucosidase [Photobacterium jeanii]
MKKTALKVTVIGAGSSYTPELIEGLLQRKNTLPINELWLVDIEEGWEKATIIAGLTERMIAKIGANIKVTLTQNRQAALAGADFVCSQFRAGGLESRIRDEQISLKYKMIGQETNGLGGFANACRTIPVALEICREMEALCPDAWLLNFTNPSGMVTEAILKHTKINAVGLCNVPAHMEKSAASLLRETQGEAFDEQKLLTRFAGLNHMVWMYSAQLNGEEKVPFIIKQLMAGNDTMSPRNIPAFQWPDYVLRNSGMIPCAYLRYYYMTQNMYELEMKEAQGEGCRGEVVKAVEAQLFELYRDPNLAEKPKQLELRGGQYYSEAACELMNAIYNDSRVVMHVNTRNYGAIQGLPDDCAVEVSSMITSAGPIPLSVPALPEQVLRLIQLMKSFETLTVKAAVEGNYDTALDALALNPIVTTGDVLEQALLETIQQNRAFMQQFAHLNQ